MHCLRGWKSRSKCGWTVLRAVREDLFPASQLLAVCWPWSVSLACRAITLISALVFTRCPTCVRVSPSYKDTNCSGLGSPTNDFIFNYFFDDPVSNWSHILRHWGSGTAVRMSEFGEHSATHKTDKLAGSVSLTPQVTVVLVKQPSDSKLVSMWCAL